MFVKFVRRNRVGVAAAGIAIAAIVSAAVVSTVAWQRTSVALKRESEALQKETEARAKAESAEKATLSLAGEFVRGIARLASAQEGAAPSMLAIADATQTAIASNETSFGASTEARSLLASAYELQAKTYAGIRANNAGEPAKGLEAIEKAIAIRSALAKESPGTKATLAHAVALIYKSDLLRVLRRTDEATSETDQAFTMLKSLGPAVNDDPAASRIFASLLLAKADQATSESEKGDFINQALQLREQAANKYPEPIYQRDLTIALNRSGFWLVANDQADKGLAQLQRALDLRATTAEKDPSARSLRDWCTAVNALLGATLQLERPISPELRAAVAKAETRTDLLAQDEAPTSRAFVDATRAIADSGRVALVSGDIAKAIDKLKSAAERSEKTGIQRADHAFERAVILHALAEAQAASGQQADAAATCRAALAVLRSDVLASSTDTSELEKSVRSILDRVSE